MIEPVHFTCPFCKRPVTVDHSDELKAITCTRCRQRTCGVCRYGTLCARCAGKATEPPALVRALP